MSALKVSKASKGHKVKKGIKETQAKASPLVV
jgi:hypothetical protein